MRDIFSTLEPLYKRLQEKLPGQQRLIDRVWLRVKKDGERFSGQLDIMEGNKTRNRLIIFALIALFIGSAILNSYYPLISLVTTGSLFFISLLLVVLKIKVDRWMKMVIFGIFLAFYSGLCLQQEKLVIYLGTEYADGFAYEYETRQYETEEGETRNQHVLVWHCSHRSDSFLLGTIEFLYYPVFFVALYFFWRFFSSIPTYPKALKGSFSDPDET